MNLKGTKKIIYTAVILAGLSIAMSSCNRGIGCPSDFSVKQVINPVVTSLLPIR